MRWLLTMLLTVALCGCTTQVEKTYKIAPQEVDQLIVKPPEGSMKPPSKAIPLRKGAPDAVNSGIMRDNNLSCSNDRAKLLILQDYIMTLFPKEKNNG